jgi:hypothetical protein
MTPPVGIRQKLDEEMRFHVDLETQKNIRLGMSPGDRAASAK